MNTTIGTDDQLAKRTVATNIFSRRRAESAVQSTGSKRTRSTRFRLGAVSAAVAAAIAVCAAAPANAVVNQSGPHSTYPWSTCTIWVGDRAINPAYAQADVQASCTTRHTIRSYVYLYRWNGSAWRAVESSNILTWTNAYASDNWSGYYVGGGNTWWQTVAYVSLDGGSYYQLTGPVAQYTPAG